jgi:competence protein CoiA
MLIAGRNGRRVEARYAERGPGYSCPNCRCPVVLKRGRIRVAHFAHKPPKTCDWAKGETLAHLEAKGFVRDALAARGLRAEVERVVPSLPDNRRADVMTWSPSGIQVAVELQHTGIGLDEIERRAFSYARAGIAQVWLAFLRPGTWARAERRKGGDEGDWLVRRYPAKPFERWIHGFNHGTIWFYDPGAGNVVRGRFADHELWVEGARWYDDAGEEVRVGGYRRWSRRWRELTLWGPYALDRVRFKIGRRRSWRIGPYSWPAGRIAHLVVDDPGAA